MTDKEIIKALKCCTYHDNCDGCPMRGLCIKPNEFYKKLYDLFNRLQAENERLEYTLLGVIHSVDKWLDGAELEQDEVNRAVTMREKTLRIVEDKQAQIERLNCHIQKLVNVTDDLVHECDCAKQEAIIDFAERLKELINPDWCKIHQQIDNLVKEMIGEQL